MVSPLECGPADDRPKFTNVMGRAGVRNATDNEAIRWLVDNPTALLDVKFLAEQIGGAAEDLLKALPKKGQRRRLADHFWCDVVGALAWVLAEIDGAIEKLRNKAIDWLVDEVWKSFRCSRDADWGGTPNGRRQPGPSRAERDRDESVADTVLKEAIKSLLQKVCDGLWAKQITFDALILKLRLLAIWLCPDVLAHRLVWEHCWVPLTRGWTEAYVLELLEGVFPGFGVGPEGEGP
ncbi:hypothetical protein HLB23_21820 [Nocardia uniformis]|uniref:Uncharacterized protein n=1 Tax=Nocardia uniformis TaxID=53432 RepID=A0A849C1G9_9NOCA|nr:hypothetical protein [Nocardia uniformis]NNH72464.1 hypothetical protein [Nocardia uniformis]